MTLKQTAKSPTLAMHELSTLRQESGQDVYKFGFGQSPFPPFAPVIEALKKYAYTNSYAPVSGLPELRETVANYHSKYDHINCTADNVLVSAGSKILLFSIMAAYENANILIPAPAWVSYRPQAELLGHKSITIKTNAEEKWRVTPDNLAESLNTIDNDFPRLLILNYPGNPDGLTYGEEELKTLAEAFRKHNIIVLSDEIYGRLHFKDNHISLARFYPEGTIITGGLSKWAGCGGWRLGTALFPDVLKDNLMPAVTGILSETISSAPTPIQWAAIEAYKDNPVILENLKHRRKILKNLGEFSAASLREAGLNCENPIGGFYIFVDFSPVKDKINQLGIKNSLELCMRIMEDTGVAILYGESFGMEYDHMSARLSFVDFDGEKALQESYKIGLNKPFSEENIKNIFPKIHKGIKKLQSWVVNM